MKTLHPIEVDPSQFEAIKVELAECKAIADQLWEVYLSKTDLTAQQEGRLRTAQQAIDAYNAYTAGLEQHGICPTLIGYRYRKNLKYG